ncbi:MAG TPA: hypothetical protein VHT53_05115 [Candidatus Elarobacter sp.]|jgi:hypothetical protein|nr:hypothetical protein [Candidatus Elarobacter sp.]
MSALTRASSLADVAFTVCTALERHAEHAVLCGGSAATYHAPHAYQSRDLDFVLHFGARARAVMDALGTIGYTRRPEGLYVHADVLFTIDFPAGPLAIGSETVSEHATYRRGDEVLYVYSATDCVRDRFMHFWAWNDQQARRVALDVAAACRNEIDYAAIVAWTDRELREAPVYDRTARDQFLRDLRNVVNAV